MLNGISQGNYSPYRSDPAYRQNFQSLSSGFRISEASSGASEAAIYSKMTARMRGLEQGAVNAAFQSDRALAAEGGLSAVNDSLLRLRQLSLQGLNDTLSDNERGILQGQMNQILSGLPNLPGGLSLVGYDVGNGADISRVDRSVNAVLGERARYGASLGRYGSMINQNLVGYESLQAARSRFADTNMAMASNQYFQNRAKDQFQLLMQRNDMARAKRALNVYR